MDENTIAQTSIFYGCYLELYESRARIHSYPVDCLVGTDVVGIVGAEIKFCRRELNEKTSRPRSRDRVCVCASVSPSHCMYHTRTSGLFRFTKRKHMIVSLSAVAVCQWLPLHNNNASHTHSHHDAGSTSLSTLLEYVYAIVLDVMISAPQIGPYETHGDQCAPVGAAMDFMV